MDLDAIITEVERLLGDMAATNARFAEDARKVFAAKPAHGPTTQELAAWVPGLRGVVEAVKSYMSGDYS